MKVKPVLNKVVVRSDEAITKSTGGLYIPEKVAEKPGRGKALYVGAGRFTDAGVRVPMDVKPGDTVFYHKNFAVPIKLNGEDLLALKEEDILLAVEEK